MPAQAHAVLRALAFSFHDTGLSSIERAAACAQNLKALVSAGDVCGWVGVRARVCVGAGGVYEQRLSIGS